MAGEALDGRAQGDLTGNDVAAGGGRPLWPSLFITDLTVNGPTSRAGDWQQGGIGIPPHRVCGMWKAAVRTVDKTKNPPYAASMWNHNLYLSAIELISIKGSIAPTSVVPADAINNQGFRPFAISSLTAFSSL